jgi:hypothetical protein
MARYTDLSRDTKDFDVFVRAKDVEPFLQVLAHAGFNTEIKFDHWLGKALGDEGLVIDVIFNSGNGLCPVDDLWFRHAIPAEVLGFNVQLVAPEEIFWQKAFILERDRADTADAAHILRSQGGRLDWRRLLSRFGPHWRVLFAHLILFGYIFPSDRNQVPPWVMQDLSERLRKELDAPPPAEKICRGTVLSIAQYKDDIERLGYQDARLSPEGNMSEENIQQWMAAFEK